MRKNHEKKAQLVRYHPQPEQKMSRQILNVTLHLCSRKSSVLGPKQISVAVSLATTLNVTQNLATKKQCPTYPHG